MPVAPYTTVSVPARRSPPSIASSAGIPVDTRVLMKRDCTLALHAAGASFGGELPFVERPQLVEGGGLSRALVVSDARDAREAQREARPVRGAALDLVVLDLHHDRR